MPFVLTFTILVKVKLANSILKCHLSVPIVKLPMLCNQKYPFIMNQIIPLHRRILFFFCPNCEECFFVSYLIPGYMEDSVGVIQEIFPIAKHTSTFSEEILSLSPDFVKIFNQAEQAENQNLHDICGIGYRKSLEFLVKDYCIKIHPDKQSTIESLPLAKCISDYIDNEKISTLAKASAWIGNDETHYTRKHQNYNIQDLKKFIKAMVAYIEYELTFTEAFELLSNPR